MPATFYTPFSNSVFVEKKAEKIIVAAKIYRKQLTADVVNSIICVHLCGHRINAVLRPAVSRGFGIMVWPIISGLQVALVARVIGGSDRAAETVVCRDNG